MRHAAGPRREIGVRTIFNLLGPLTNPAGARHQLVGVFEASWVEPLAHVLGRLGTRARARRARRRRARRDLHRGRDARSPSCAAGEVRTLPASIRSVRLEARRARRPAGGERRSRARRSSAAFSPARAGPARDIVLLNAAAAIYVGDRAPTLEAGIEAAGSAIDAAARAPRWSAWRATSQGGAANR